ncbi:MAG: T9SS type A sorting domain-containing protein, partial [Calditrichota bacterium]
NMRVTCRINMVYLDTTHTGWIIMEPAEFALEPGEEIDLVVTIDQAGLPEGEYEAEIHYLTDDPQVSIVRVYNLRVSDVTEPNLTIPTEFRLYRPFPNPFNSTAILRFDLPQAGMVKLTLFDISGRRIRTLADDYYPAGSQAVTLDAAQLPAGVYLLKLENGTHRSLQRAVILK